MSTSSSNPRAWRVASAEDLARALAGVRQAKGLSQSELAELIGVHRSYLSEIEGGARQVQMVERILRGLRRMGAEVVVTLPADPGA